MRALNSSYYGKNTKEEFEMKDFTKLALVGFVGYLVGFYECKYKAQNALLRFLVEYEKGEAQK